MRPLEGLVTTRTGSRCSRVGPAVTSTCFPCHGARPSTRRVAAARMASGSLIRPGRSLGPSASGPASGPTKCQPRAASVATLARVAGWAYIASFMAGAARTGPVRARPIRLPQGGEDRAPGERLERDRPHELRGGCGEHDVHHRAVLGEPPGEGAALVAGDPARH